MAERDLRRDAALIDLFRRGYVTSARAALHYALRTPALRRTLLARMAAELDGGLDPDTAIVLSLARILGEDAAKPTTPSEERKRMAGNVRVADDAPEGAIDIDDFALEGIPARRYVPAGLARPSPALVYVHGGGWVIGDLDTHDPLCRRIALIANIRVISIAPRLAPEDAFPATIDDTLTAFRAVAARANELGIDPTGLGIGGDSAGGNLSAVVGLETRHDAIKPALTALLYPATDATWSQPSIQTRGEGYLLTREWLGWYRNNYIGHDAALQRDPRVSPLLAPDLAGAPRALVAVAGFDPLCDEGVAYAKRLEAAGVPVDLLRYESLIHGFANMTSVSRQAMFATRAIARRIGEVLYG